MEQYRTVARERLDTDDFVVPDDAPVDVVEGAADGEHVGDGAWVRVWAWVYRDEVA